MEKILNQKKGCEQFKVRLAKSFFLAEFKKLFIRWDCDFARDFIVTSLLPVDPKLEDQLEETSLWTQDAK